MEGTGSLPKAILFDLDSTILEYDDPEECWLAVCREFAPEVGVAVESLLRAIVAARDWQWGDSERHRQARLTLIETRRRIAESALSSLGIENMALAHTLGDTYARMRDGGARLAPRAADILVHFRSRGVRLGLVTNGASELQRAKIGRFGLAGYFHHIQVEGEFGAGKPDDSVFRHALSRLGVGADEAWMVGDDLDRDIAGAQGVGIYAVWVDWRGHGLPPGSPVQPDRIVRGITDLLQEPGGV